VRSYFFLEGFFVFGAFSLSSFLEKSLDNELLILAALFLCITFFFFARSVSDIARKTSFSFLDFLAMRKATSNCETIFLFTISFLFELLRALFAVFVTGIKLN
jgi:hypothetical protein